MKFYHLIKGSAAALTLSGALAGPIAPDSWDASRPDAHAPIGVMGDHTHSAGEWMSSYRYMFMHMDTTWSDDSSVPDGQGFPIRPTEMDMQMHMFGLMYAPSDRLTLLSMLHYTEMSMNHITPMTRFSTESSGWGDLHLGGLYRFHEAARQRAHLGLNLILPSGEFESRDVTPMSAPQKTVLPYPMQVAAGAWGLKPSLTYLSQHPDWSWGAQSSLSWYLNDNDAGWHPGIATQSTAWVARVLDDSLSVSGRLSLNTWSDIQGSNPITEMMQNMVPTARTDLRAGTRIDAAIGVNYTLRGTGVRLATEVGLPLYQNLDGPQLGTDFWVTAGLQFAW